MGISHVDVIGLVCWCRRLIMAFVVLEYVRGIARIARVPCSECRLCEGGKKFGFW